MTRLRLLVLIAALLLTACGQSRSVDSTAPPTAATIDGLEGGTQEITRTSLEEVVDAVTGSDRFMAAVFQGTLPEGFRQTILTQLIQLETMRDLVAQEGGEVTDEDRTQVSDQLGSELEGLLATSGGEGETDEVLDEISPYTDLLVERNALLSALGRALTGDATVTTQDVVCARHILVAEEAEAQDLLAQLADGADFAALATESSQDPGSGAQGGDLGCAPPGQYVPEFAAAVEAAPLDEVVGPVQTDFGYHVITVYERRTEEVPVDPMGPAGEAITQRLQSIEVEVSPDLGSWNPDTLTVVEA